VEGPSQETDLLWQARLSTQAPEIDGLCYINDFGSGEPRPGEIRTLRVTEAHDYDLVGELVDLPESRYIAPQVANPFPILSSHPAQTFSIR
jgi:ribosomal protein S12 methylthiotransferase